MIAVAVLSLLSCAPKTPEPATPLVQAKPHAPMNPVAVTGVTDEQLQQILDVSWDNTMRRSPLWATQLGDHRFDDQIGDASEAAIFESRRQERRVMERARALDPASLNAADALTRELFIFSLEQDVNATVCEFYQWSLSPRGNAVVNWNYLPELHRVETVEDGQNLLKRYQAIANAVDDEIDNLRKGLAAGRVSNAQTVQKVIEQIDTEIGQPLQEWTLYAPIAEAHPEWSEDERSAFQAEMTATISEQIQPAFGRYLDVIRDEILPAARGPDAVGLSALPDGEACYAALVSRYTTLKEDPAVLHQIGLDELEKIHAEFAAIGGRALGTSDLARIFEQLRTDSALYFETAEQIEDKAASALAKAEAAIPGFFGRLPKAKCEIRRVPEYEAPYTTIAYYQQPNPDGSKPGEYYVNVYAPETRPRHEAEVLAFHESIPGHHLQIAISQELDALPAFRRYDGQTAFVEGWALYTERLADEMGLYSGDLDRLGMLSFDAWRASRLVVDTGLHQMGWSRVQAEDFMRENTPLADNNIVNEVDRYINTPGQALAYKMGQLTIWRLRREAEATLGDAFSLPGFHDVVLGAGAVPLPVLERRVQQWVESQHKGSTGGE
ncbi:MAG: DUF885 domain-containing protein [Myxococcota bacterium]